MIMEKIEHSQRFSSLDIMRGVAIVLMIEAHIRISSNLIGSNLIGSNSFGLKFFCAVLAAPFFLIIAGVGYNLFLESRIKRYKKISFVFLETFWRAFILVLISTGIYLICSILFSSFEYYGIIVWNVFQVIGAGYILGFLIRNSFWKKIISVISLFALSVLINTYHIAILYPLSKGLFPLIPYLAYFILGQLLCEFYKQENISLEKNRNLISISLIFLMINLLVYYIFPYKPISHHVYFKEFLMIASIYMLINLIIIRFVDIKNQFRKIFIPFENIGKISFTAYYLQWVVVFFPYYYIFKSLPTIGNLIILIISVMVLATFERIWRKYDYIFGLEWILRKVTAVIMNKVEYKYKK